MTCLQTFRVAGPCSKCGEFQAKGVHLIDECALFCGSCCPRCSSQASLDWPDSMPKTVTGTQEALF